MNWKLLGVAALAALAFTGCLSHRDWDDSINFVTDSMGLTDSKEGDPKETTNYSSKGLLKDFELKEGTEILSYGTARFKTYGQFHEQTGYAVVPDTFGPMGEFHTPAGLYEFEYLSFDDEVTLDDALDWSFKVPDDLKVEITKAHLHKLVTPGKNQIRGIILRHNANTAITKPIHSIKGEAIYRMTLKKHDNAVPTAYLLNHSSHDKRQNLSANLYTKEIPGGQICEDMRHFNPYTFIVKKVIPDAENDYQTLNYKGESDGKLVFEYTETKGLTTGNPVTIRVKKSADGTYNIKGVELLIMEDEEGQWYRLRSFFHGDKRERFWDMLPFPIPGVQSFLDEDNGLEPNATSYYRR